MVKRKIDCNLCKIKTNHQVLYDTELKESEDIGGGDYTVDFFQYYELIQCLGCDDISFRYDYYFSEDYSHHDRDINVVIYPQREIEHLSIKCFDSLPSNLEVIYKELIGCFNNNYFILCAVGIRSLLEGFCLAQGIEKGNIKYKNDDKVTIKKSPSLQGKINGLYANKLLTKKMAIDLNAHRFLGNDAVHELSAPSKEELKLAIKIIEHVLEGIYQIPIDSEDLNQLRNRRQPRCKT